MVNLLGCNADSGWWIQPPSATRQEELMVSWRILYLRQQIIPLVKENTMGTLYNSPKKNVIKFTNFCMRNPLRLASEDFARLLLLLLFFLLFLFFFLLFLTLVLVLLAFVSHRAPLFSVVPHLLAARTPLWREFCLWVLSRFQLPSTTLSNPFDSLFTNIYIRRLECKRF